MIIIQINLGKLEKLNMSGDFLLMQKKARQSLLNDSWEWCINSGPWFEDYNQLQGWPTYHWPDSMYYIRDNFRVGH